MSSGVPFVSDISQLLAEIAAGASPSPAPDPTPHEIWVAPGVYELPPLTMLPGNYLFRGWCGPAGAVTVLTSLDESVLGDIGVGGPLEGQVERLAALAQAAALDGVVASPREIGLIRARCGERFAIVTPGIRGGADAKGDQTRTDSAARALQAGASYLVVGRPIIGAPDPRAAAERIVAECRAAAASPSALLSPVRDSVERSKGR